MTTTRELAVIDPDNSRSDWMLPFSTLVTSTGLIFSDVDSDSVWFSDVRPLGF